MDKVTIPFETTWTSVGIGLSGGADSALLTYLICDTVVEHQMQNFKIHVINHIRCWKTKPWQRYDALGVYDWLKNRFPTIEFELHTNFIAPELEWGNKGPTLVDEYGKTVSGDNIEARAFAEYVCVTNKVDAFFNGVTRNPRDVEFKGMQPRNVEPSEDNKHLEIMEHMGFLACHPFRFIEKSWVIAQYRELDLLDLFHITRSCEGDNSTRPEVFMGLDYTTYQPNQPVPICGRCFWCRERRWALEQ
jgi:hypothetical protein